MRNIAIGATFMVTGAFMLIGLIIAAALHMPLVNTWSGSRLMFAIMDVRTGLGSMILFMVTLFLLICGFLLLAREILKGSKAERSTGKEE